MKLQYKYKNIKYIILYILKSEWNVVEIFSITIQIAQTEIVNLKYAQWKYVNFAKTPIYIAKILLHSHEVVFQAVRKQNIFQANSFSITPVLLR